MSAEELNPQFNLDKTLLKEEVARLWMEENSERNTKDWEKEWERQFGVEFYIAFDLLCEDKARNVEKELRENPTRILNEVRVEMGVLRQIEEALARQESMIEVFDEHTSLDEVKEWKFKHREMVVGVFHRMIEDNPALLESVPINPDLITSGIEDLASAA